jgi:hypothetical protein
MKRRWSVVAPASMVLLVAFPVLANQISMGPQAMEGNLKVSPGTLLMAGYDFTIPGSHPEIFVQVDGAAVVFEAECVVGGGGGEIDVFMPLQGYTVPKNSGAWFPSGEQNNPAVYEGSVVVPDLCGGGQITLRSGGTFRADLQSSDTSRAIHVRWHYSANGTSGSWSGTGSFLPDPISGGGG